MAVGCSSHQPEHREEQTFLVTSPIIKDTTILKDYVCQIRSINHIELRTQERGYLQQIFADEGRYVQKGQLLFKVMPVLYQAEKEKAQANLNYAEIEYLNTKRLADSNIVSANELALAKARLDKEKADLALASAHLNFTDIRAPFSGILDKFNVRLGSLLEE
ncbi:MAG TPA: biotin/lipoyl-binding protein, partial [Phnomibacter sp.]|nr:biotin/lipoyl-binding protein [Phnomibacter sp.]